jgi:NAD dependent epimerase/dehydratase family enzyme
MVRLARGQMVDEMALASTRVQPAKLLESGSNFQFPYLGKALANALGSTENASTP